MTFVFGAGGIGCAVGYALLAAGDEITFVDADAAKVEYGRKHGVQLDDHKPLPAKFVHFDDWNWNHYEGLPGIQIYLATKCYDNAAVLAKLEETIDMTPIQNGYDSRIEASDRCFEGIASFVAKCEPGKTRTRITRPGQLHIGTTIRSDLRGAFTFGIPRGVLDVVGVDDIRPIKATKLMYNAAISPLAAAAGLDNGELLTLPAAQRLFFDLIAENYAILQAANVPLGKVGPFHPRTVNRILKQRWLARLMAKHFARSLRGTYCSMAGEIQKGRTELDNYTGHLLRLADQHGHPAPLNRRVYDVVSRMTAERATPRREVLNDLA